MSRPISLLVLPANKPARTWRSRSDISAMPKPRPVCLLVLLIFLTVAGCCRRHCGQKLIRTIRDRQEVHGSSFHHLHPKAHVAFGVPQDNDRQADAPGLELPRNDQTTGARPANVENDAAGRESRGRLQERFAGRKDSDP